MLKADSKSYNASPNKVEARRSLVLGASGDEVNVGKPCTDSPHHARPSVFKPVRFVYGNAM